MIKKVSDVAQVAFKQLGRYQNKKSEPIRTDREWLDEIFGGLLPGDIVTIAGSSGGGKSFENQRLKNNIMNPELNPAAAEFIWLDFSMEMRFLSNIMRDLNQKLGKSKKRILTEAFTDEEKELVRKYNDSITDGRFFIEEEVVTPQQFEQQVDEFLDNFKDKKAIFISVDHIALTKASQDDKKGAVDAIVEVINRMKKKYKNSYWIILSQLNRGINARSKEKDNNSMPNRSDLYQSDTMFFISDYVYVTHNPYRAGIKAFGRVNEEVYSYLHEHFIESKNGRASFDTLGKIFYIILKSRENDSIFRDIFIDDIPIPNKEKYRMPDELKEAEMSAPRFTVDMTQLPKLNQNTSAMQNAAGEGFDEEPDPF